MPHMRDLLINKSNKSQQLLIKALMARPGSSQTELAKVTGLSGGTVSQLLPELKDEGFVEITEEGSRKRVQLVRTEGIAVGIELGYQHIVVVARRADQDEPSAKLEDHPSMGANARTEDWVREAVNLIGQVAEKVGGSFEDLVTVGMGVPRIVDSRTGELAPPVLPPWKAAERGPAQALQAALRDRPEIARARTPVTVQFDNDATLGAWAESVYQHPGKTLLYVKASTGVGAGIVIGGEVFRGAGGSAGELGHMKVREQGEYCLCGGRGCLETLVGADALLGNAKRTLGARSQNPPEDLRMLIERAGNGDVLCRRVLGDAAVELGTAIGSVCNLLNPDVAVLGGAFGQIPEEALAECRAAIGRSAMNAAHTNFELVRSALDRRASAHGALLHGIYNTKFPR